MLCLLDGLHRYEAACGNLGTGRAAHAVSSCRAVAPLPVQLEILRARSTHGIDCFPAVSHFESPFVVISVCGVLTPPRQDRNR
jgi:hypothetical protein